ncbi:MAG: Conserved TM helix repeat-containing protein [Candidatus Jorgensenbacteria bacterium GW2011_GWA1_48_13]|uniref:Conserved TM helix repeat-containing protein n=2 Tax=Candidatus Joergenseniibacteriota TaxID=1752739 RepID=A0A0G1W9H4_9BACT|nr:MAG: Conserved TM helix repeat-containing protein [Candidatus Jorgensenbacteria bacterium GW2011_GWA1_48_13]KKU99228.1 MAG: Conserved TM helix repeat-containing protein [Candidatus Jorgensenbacteria bacterium GW2011_GWC1_48_8]KKW15423.1 MAG: Conserved TM helix repeat-containing protein [Candidatus Jorgensenbacteria bacterium GW2011_GWB1_50_10]
MVIQDWLSVVVGSLQNLWVGAIGVLGSIVGALIVLIVGLIVASGLGALVERVVGLLKVDKLLSNLGVHEYFERAGLNMNSGRFVGRLVYWFLVVVFLLAATDILGFYTLSNFLREVLLYIPNVIVAVLIMLAAVVVANFMRNLVRASVKSARLHAAHFLSSLTWWAVVLFGFFAALSQLGIAVSIINSLVTGFVAMLALAGGIAFGLGGKDYAEGLVNRLREHTEGR